MGLMDDLVVLAHGETVLLSYLGRDDRMGDGILPVLQSFDQLHRAAHADSHVALGGDLDGCDILAAGFSSVADYVSFYEYLMAQGYGDSLLDRLFFTNLFALF